MFAVVAVPVLPLLEWPKFQLYAEKLKVPEEVFEKVTNPLALTEYMKDPAMLHTEVTTITCE